MARAIICGLFLLVGAAPLISGMGRDETDEAHDSAGEGCVPQM